MKTISSSHTPDTAAVEKPSFSFGREYILSRTRQFQRVYKEGRRYRGRWMTFVIYTGTDADSFKCGFVVRKRDYHRAVDRHRVKRRLREIVRHARPSLCSQMWMVVQARPGIPSAPWKELTDDFYALCDASGCYDS